MIDKRFWLALTAMLVMIVAYNVYYQWRFGDYIAAQKEAEKAAAVEAPTPAADDATRAAAEAAPADPVPVSPDAAMASGVADTMEKVYRVDTGVATFVVTNRGALPTSILLDHYHDADGNPVDLLFDYDAYLARKLGEGSEPVVKNAAVYPTLGLRFPRRAFSDKINGALFAVDGEGGDVTVGDAPVTLTFTLRDGSGVSVRKIYTFHPGSYEFDFELQVATDPRWGEFDYALVWFGLGDEKTDLQAVYSYQGPIVFANGERVAEEPDEENPSRTFQGAIRWSALTNRYYAAVQIPVIEEGLAVTDRYVDEGVYSIEYAHRATVQGLPEQYRFYVGPKAHAVLKGYDRGIPSVIHYGFFDVLAKPLFTILNLFHGWTGNWGWSIILLTILVKGVFFPLSQKSFRSMQKLQKLQPQLKKIQELYKDDKEKLNAALMDLYREQKVSPLGGCLPILFQIPIFFALYKVLLESIELKGADFVLWIHDLSVQDPYYVTPVLMGASMLVQQMMTPATGDPLQRKVMMGLPVIFTFMFLTFPAGLVVYWLVNNVLTILQQWVIRREAEEKK